MGKLQKIMRLGNDRKKDFRLLWNDIIPFFALIFSQAVGIFIFYFLAIQEILRVGMGFDWETIYRVFGLAFLLVLVGIFPFTFSLPYGRFDSGYIVSLLSCIVAFFLLNGRVREKRNLVLWSTLTSVVFLFIFICIISASVWDNEQAPIFWWESQGMNFIDVSLQLHRWREGAELTDEIRWGTRFVWLIILVASYLIAWFVYRKVWKKYVFPDREEQNKPIDNPKPSAGKGSKLCLRTGNLLLILSIGILVFACSQWVMSTDKLLSWSIVQGKVERVENGYAYFSYRGYTIRSQQEVQPGKLQKGDNVQLLCRDSCSPRTMIEYDEKLLYDRPLKLAKVGGWTLLLSLLFMFMGHKLFKRKDQP